MPSTYSPNLRLELIGSGEQQNVWGNTTNYNLGTLIENAITGYAVLSAIQDGIDYTLLAFDGSNDEARCMTLFIPTIVVLTMPANIIAPAVPKMYVIINESDGGYPVNISSGGVSQSVSVPNGTTRVVFTMGGDFYYAGSTALQVLTRAGATVDVGLN